jgi:hypothetical protein
LQSGRSQDTRPPRSFHACAALCRSRGSNLYPMSAHGSRVRDALPLWLEQTLVPAASGDPWANQPGIFLHT